MTPERIAGRYELVRELGRGGEGRVLLALDHAQEAAPRALKIVAEADAARVRWELELLTRIVHPSLARVYELVRVEQAVPRFGLARGALALVSELVAGVPADALARARARDREGLIELAWLVLDRVGRALAALHAHGFVHGDVKPANIVVAENAADAKLIDLGLARAPGFESTLSGTPGYLAPELLRGELSPAADLYALGVSVWRLLAPSGEESASASWPSLLARALSDPRASEPLPSWVPVELARTLTTLRAADASARPAARELVQRVSELLPERLRTSRAGAAGEALAAERALAVTALPFVGQRVALEELTRALEASAVIAVVGPRGSGRSRLVREAVRAAQSACVQRGVTVPTYRVLRGDSAPSGVSELFAQAAIVHVEAQACSLEQAQAWVRAAEVAGQRCCVVLEREPDDSAPLTSVRVVPLTQDELETLLEQALPGAAVKAPLVREAAAVSGSLAGRVCRVLATALAAGDDPVRAGVLRSHAGAVAGEVAAVPEEARELAELLALAGGSLPQPAALACLGDAARLAAAARLLCTLGCCTRDADGELELLPSLARSLRAALAPERRRMLANRVPDGALRGPARAFLAHAAGQRVAAASAFEAEASAALRKGEPERAERIARAGVELLGSESVALQLLLADALRALGRYTDALAALETAPAPSALVVRAEIARLLGRVDEARALASAHAGQGGELVLARLALDAGDFAQASTRARPSLDAQDDATRLRAAEIFALAALSLGDVAEARRRAEEAIALARVRNRRAAEARLSSVLACVHRELGEGQATRREFARAYELANAAGEQHAAATFLVNLATSQLEAGELGPALEACREGARRLARLGRERDLARVLYNLAFACQLAGDGDAALAALSHAAIAAERGGDASAAAYAAVLRIEVELSQAEPAKAAALLAALPRPSGLSPIDTARVAARAAAAAARLADASRAGELLELARTAANEAGSEAAQVELELASSALCAARSQKAEALAAAERALVLARARGELGVELSALLASAQAAETAGEHGLARTRHAEVRSLLDAAALTLLPADRARLREVPAYRAALFSLPKTLAAEGGNDARWRRLAALAKRLTAPERPARLHAILLDAAIDLSGAERAYLLWSDAEGLPRVRAARGLADRAASDDAVSRSIASRVIASGQALSTVDASADARLSGAASVHALSLRSVLCVPVRMQGEIRGALYLDDRLRPFAFGEEEVALLGDLADLAAIALDASELLRRERRAVRRLHVARERLSRKVEAQAATLDSLRDVSERIASHRGIVAHSPLMQEAMRLALRVARAEVPVLLRGESGTGKELVARAIHAESLRKERPFVSENCGAIPETLLESVLFGHVKGAFTGADRRRSGLFEVADGGTLFLDEIGEMSPSMQTRLLRVLQDGEIRPVGGERNTHVDVRVIAATHRDLEAMVKEGRFREDLYYRLAVVNVSLPALRDRGEDIAPLVAHFIAKHGNGRKVRVDRRALERLRTERWPGNVRQLENEVRRALALSDDVIREDGFSFSAAEGGRPAGEDNPNAELDLRLQIDTLERRLIKRALEQAKGNQTKAAELLGVSRFGLQKMQKRLAQAN